VKIACQGCSFKFAQPVSGPQPAALPPSDLSVKIDGKAAYAGKISITVSGCASSAPAGFQQTEPLSLNITGTGVNVRIGGKPAVLAGDSASGVMTGTVPSGSGTAPAACPVTVSVDDPAEDSVDYL
jgi:uncharacterized Zn-binding protein involved in type VI secretion